jgi:hypothetical protein
MKGHLARKYFEEKGADPFKGKRPARAERLQYAVQLTIARLKLAWSRPCLGVVVGGGISAVPSEPAR